eukprot:6213908-Pleurochrysis_carterae.AAC.1
MYQSIKDQALRLGPITGVFLRFIVTDKTRFTKRPKSTPQRDAVATDESAADRRADAQIDRSSSASDACTLEFTHSCYGDHERSEASMQQLKQLHWLRPWRRGRQSAYSSIHVRT